MLRFGTSLVSVFCIKCFLMSIIRVKNSAQVFKGCDSVLPLIERYLTLFNSRSVCLSILYSIFAVIRVIRHKIFPHKCFLFNKVSYTRSSKSLLWCQILFSKKVIYTLSLISYITDLHKTYKYLTENKSTALYLTGLAEWRTTWLARVAIRN